jgi:ATP-dependent Zn protease
MPELTAYHEAGHALMAYLLGGKVRQVTIEPDNDDGPRRSGDTQIHWRRSSLDEREFARISVQVCLAGPVAEMIYSGEPYHPAFVAEWAADWRGAFEAAALLHLDERKRTKFLEEVARQLYRRLEEEETWMALAALADSLLAHETLEQEQVEEVLQELLG